MGVCCNNCNNVPPHKSEIIANDIDSLANTLPTYENIAEAYEDMGLPEYRADLIEHSKLQVIFMILNIMRKTPTFFVGALKVLKRKYKSVQ